MQAGIIGGAVETEKSLVMTDVNPYTLGVRTTDGYSSDVMSVIIPRNVTIPTTRRERYYTAWDDQDTVSVQVYQGEYASASRNHMVGEFEVGDIPLAPAGKEEIDISFSYNQNGILQVSAEVVSTGKVSSLTIDMIDVSLPDEKSAEEWKKSPLAREFRSLIRRAEKAIRLASAGGDGESAGELETMLAQLKYAVMKEYRIRAEELEEEIREYLNSGEENNE